MGLEVLCSCRLDCYCCSGLTRAARERCVRGCEGYESRSSEDAAVGSLGGLRGVFELQKAVKKTVRWYSAVWSSSEVVREEKSRSRRWRLEG